MHKTTTPSTSGVSSGQGSAPLPTQKKNLPFNVGKMFQFGQEATLGLSLPTSILNSPEVVRKIERRCTRLTTDHQFLKNMFCCKIPQRSLSAILELHAFCQFRNRCFTKRYPGPVQTNAGVSRLAPRTCARRAREAGSADAGARRPRLPRRAAVATHHRGTRVARVARHAVAVHDWNIPQGTVC